jgi:lysozyme family protein
MTTYTKAFEAALDHSMLYEVGGFWDVNHPAVAQGLIDTRANRRAVGYVNDPTDRGGETKFGVAKNANPDLNIARLTWDGAKAVYYVRYWLAAKCDKLPPRVAVLHYDGAVNHGIKRANAFLQRAAGVAPDGAIGPVTLAKIARLDQIQLAHNICNQREQFYRQIVRNNPSQVKYLNGWLRRIAEMRAFVTDPKRSFAV